MVKGEVEKKINVGYLIQLKIRRTANFDILIKPMKVIKEVSKGSWEKKMKELVLLRDWVASSFIIIACSAFTSGSFTETYIG